MDGAEVYLLMIRKSLLPILGESMAPAPYFQQVEILDWDWKIVNQDEIARRKDEDELTDLRSTSREELRLRIDSEKLQFDDRTSDEIKRLMSDESVPMEVRLQKLEKLQEKALDEMGDDMQQGLDEDQDKAAKQRDVAARKKELDRKKKAKQKDDEKNNLKFNISKRVDFASTQMLNCMKAGEILPRVVLTIMHRSVNAPLLLVITAKNLRFTNYAMSVEVDETMADMKEEWEAEFSEISFLYSNRGTAGGPKNAAEALTTQQMRVFTMTSRD